MASSTVSAAATASAGVATFAAVSPAASEAAGSREPKTTACPARAKARPSVPPMLPVPMTAVVPMALMTKPSPCSSVR